MSSDSLSPLSDRRTFLAGSGLALGSLATGLSTTAQDSDSAGRKFKFCLNMSTIRGQELDAAAEIEVAGKAGYDAIEP